MDERVLLAGSSAGAYSPYVPARRRVGKVTAAMLYMLIMGVLFCGSLYPLAFRQYDKQVKAEAAALPDYSRTPPPVPYAIGHPVKVEVPSVGVSLPIVDGAYDESTRAWTLTNDKVQFATITKEPNTRKGQTFIYGHATSWVFGPLLRLQPGAEAFVTTDNGFVFSYKLDTHEVVNPTDIGVLDYDGSPRLTLQTCTGPTLSEFRQLFYFTYTGHKRL
ncbi:sortase [Candidatus Saccharibacteria bacterium]|nr:sortase [Candidatus Saccharibacteria bacterium]